MNHHKIKLSRLRHTFPLRNRHPEYRRQCRLLLAGLREGRPTRSQRLQQLEGQKATQFALSIAHTIDQECRRGQLFDN